MDTPQVIKEIDIEENDKKKLSWLGGVIDGDGYFSFDAKCATIGIVNTDPLLASRCISIFKKFGIEAKTHERKPGSLKSSKKRRYDIYLYGKDKVGLASNILFPFVKGKNKQIELIIDFCNGLIDIKKASKKMMYLNQTSNILIIDDEILWKKLGIKLESKYHQNLNEETKKINILPDFCDSYYLAGIIDTDGTLGINVRNNKYCNTNRFTPVMRIVNTNKRIIEHCYSTIKNLEIGCHISNRESEKRNRMRWDLSVSGLKRVHDFLSEIINILIIKKQQAEELLFYCKERLSEPKGVNLIGEQYKSSLESLKKNL